MKKLVLLACLGCLPTLASASCEDLKAQIDAKLQGKGITSYSLEVVPVAAATSPASGVAAASDSGKVVGTCESDTKQIIYKRIR